MKIALVTTTINVPKVLALYAKHDQDVMMFITGDRKTPDAQVIDFLREHVKNFQYIGIDRQHKLGYLCSQLLGENTDSRRNVAVLEALKWGAEIIISVDDDMIPMHVNTLSMFGSILQYGFTGLQVGAGGAWLDVGQHTMQQARQRGLPPEHIDVNTVYSGVCDAPVGIAQGTILGVPDTDAATTIVNRPFVHSITDILRHGFVANLMSRAVFNSQFTAFRRDLAPAFGQFYNWHGRNTDIIASLVMRRIARDRGLYTYYGSPTGFHARKARPTWRDHQAEQFGLTHIESMALRLEISANNPGRFDPVGAAQFYYGVLPELSAPSSAAAVMEAWFDDVRKVL